MNKRLEGSITELKTRYGLENLELAYNASKTYLGYGWKKGFLDSLKKKQTAGENIKIFYEDGVFTGKAHLYKIPETADDTNRYLPGAVMTLYDAVEVKPNGGSEDYAYDGVNVERDKYGNVSRMYVQKGYAGTKTLYVLDKTNPDQTGEEDYNQYTYDQQEDDKGAGVWTYKTVEREDTDILFYDLGGLEVLKEEKGILYGHDQNGKKIQAKNGESIFALKNGTAYLEIICADYENLIYSSKDKVFSRVPAETEFYHLDSDAGRDSRIDPYTGMAFVAEENTKKLLTWPVKISCDQYGNIIAREKIKTSRIATIESDTENEYTIGTYDSHTGSLKKSVNPILNKYGQPVYYQRSAGLYRKGSPVYDRDGDYVRYKYSDNLKEFNDNAYQVNKNEDLKNIGQNTETEADDKPLYHRQGEAYLIENTWTSGARTPNDPFRTEMTDGQVDVLKRVPAGTYILEEIKAPTGYVKIIPTGVTVDGVTTVQTARATDETINGWFDKVDAPEHYQAGVLDRDGVLPEEQSRIEGKGSFSYENVSGAGLALYRAKRIGTTDRTAHPSGYYLEKAENTPARWRVFDEQNKETVFTAKWLTGDSPKLLEAIPKGYYILEETEAPSGYIRSSMEVEIKEKGGLQTFTLPNDHTKIEIFKYMETGGKKVPLSNDHRAELALYEAVTDANGIVMENGIPKYDPSKETDRWMTDDCTGYTGFIREYEKMYDEYGSGFTTLVFQADKETELTADRISSEETDKKESVTQLWKTSEGKQIRVQVTKNLLPTGYYGFDYDYKFNYEALSGNTVSYDTPDGNHRIDYLAFNGSTQKGEKRGYYVLVETKTPEGFATAKPKAVVTEETPDIQLYALKNEPMYIYLSKVSEDGKILKGAELALYKATADGSLLMDNAHLIDKWISGSEGVYTKEDADNKTIPEGFAAGDLKPHKISPIPYGTYYLAELTAPAGYKKMEPQRIVVTADLNPLIRAVNILKKGIVTIEKTDSKNSEIKLSGAVFEIKNRETGDTFLMVTDKDGAAKSQPVETGTVGPDGSWMPYHFTIKEITPPDTYQLNLTVYHFQFEEDVSVEELGYSISIPDEPTKITISKSDFDNGAFIKGAELSVYRTKVVNGRYEAEGEALESWVTDGNLHTIKGKLTAGRTYMLKELKAPSGYNKAEPVIFTISDDGRRIVNVSNNLNTVKFKTSASFIDAVESVTVSGRQADKTVLQLTDLDTGEVIRIPAETKILTAKDGLTEGHRYEQKEITCYTDGNERTSSRIIFRLNFAEDGTYAVTSRLPERTMLSLEEKGGEIIEEWAVTNLEHSGYEHTVFNPEYEDSQTLEVISENGRYGSGIMAGSIIRYELTYKNTGKDKKNMRIAAVPDSQTEYMPANSTGGGRELNGIITWSFRDVMPGEGGSVILTVAVKTDAKDSIRTLATMGDNDYDCVNPVTKEGGLTITNHISGTAKGEYQNRDYRYHLTMTDSTGQPLKGAYPYTGSDKGLIEGFIKSGDTITLKGDGFITLSGMAWGTNYQVTQEAPDDMEISSGHTEGVTGKKGMTAVFLNKKNDSSIREVFKKSETYHLTETTVYQDGSSEISDKLAFTLDENASAEDINMKDKPTRVVLSKADITGSKELPGAHMEIRDEAGELIEKWISTETPHELTAVLEPGKTYIMTEILPPEGYAYAETITFTVSEDGTVDKVQMNDKATRVEISKMEITGEQELAGAKLEIRDAAGAVVERWVSDGTPHVMTGELKAGETYTLVETAAPDGYLTAAPVTFTVSMDGTIDKVKMRDEPTRIFIEKRGYTASADGETDLGQLDGAHIKIEDKNKKIMYQFITKGGEHHEITGILSAGETYTAVETEAPYGYELAEPVTFTMPEDKEVVTIVMLDKKIPELPPEPGKPDVPKITFKKYDGVTFEGLEGAEFTIYRFDGSVYTVVSTGSDGRVTITRPKAGTYTFKETKAPEGYLLSDKVYTFTITADGTVSGTLNIPNQRIPEVPLIKKDTHTGEQLAGAVFEIYDSTGRQCGRGTTDINGVWSFKPLQGGTYTVVERSAPKGYRLNSAPGIFTVSSTGEISGQTVINNEKKEKKTGRITASYGSGLNGRGYAKTSEQGRWFRGIPKTGEVYGAAGSIIAFILMLGIGILLWRKKKHEKENE